MIKIRPFLTSLVLMIRPIWYFLILLGFVLMYSVFTSDHVRNVDNAWLWTAILDHGNILIDLIMLYIASRVINHDRTHHIIETEKEIGPLRVGIMAAWLIAIALVISQ